ncbi:unnamed protein product [Mucor circinelloides]
MSSDNQTTPTTDNEVPKEPSETPAVEPSNNNAIDVHALKERIIATNKLFKYLSDAKNELAAREAQISTLNTNLGLSIKSLQESDDKCKKLAEQVQTLENQLKAKSVHFDSLSETNKKLKNDLRTQADLAKRMGSSAAEFRIAKDQVAKLTEENKQLKESLSKLQAERDQLDEDAMETNINHNLTVESLQEEINDLKLSLTTDDSALVSLKLQLEMEQKKLIKADAHSKALEERLSQSNEQIRQLKLEKSRQAEGSSQINAESMEQMKRVHTEEVESLKGQIQQLSAKLERKVAVPISANPSTHPDLSKKYHKLQAEYQFIKRTNAFLEQELRRLLENEAEQRGFGSDNDLEDADKEYLRSSPTKPAPAQATVQRSNVVAPRTSALSNKPSPPKEPVVKSRDPRLAYQQQQQQQQQAAATEEESLLQQKSGLIAPAPQINATKTVKKRKSLLEKFANAKNPSKVLERAKAPASSNSSAPTLLKKRLHNEVDSENQTAATCSTVAPVSEAMPTNVTTAPASKRTKPDYHLNHVIEELFNRQNGKLLPTLDECKEILPNLLEEMHDCYTRIKSTAVPTDTELAQFGASELHLPKSVDQREKLYAWFLVSLFKVNRDEFDQFMFKFAKSISNCPPAKTPLNHRLVRLVRLFVVACKAEESLGRLRSLIYGLFRTKAFHSTIIPILLNAGIMWKESFSFEATNPQFTSLPNTFVSSIYFISCNSSSVKNMNGMYDQLSTIFNWPSQPKPILECVQDALAILQSDYFKQLHAEDRGKFDLLSFNLITSFELAFIVLDDWNQTYDVFIRTQLWPLLNAEVIDVVAMELLGVLARLGISNDPTKPNKPGVVTLLDTFSTIIKLGEDIDPNEKHLQFAATKAMAAVAGSHRDYRKFLLCINDI